MKRSGSERFPDTRWSLVRRAGNDTPVARRALEEICRSYWGPLYAFARRSGKSPSDAEDLTQDFFAHLLEKETFAKIRQEGGKLRSFLLTAFRNFSTDRLRRDCAAKRGGGLAPLSMEVDGVEAAFAESMAEEETPQTTFEKQWALGLVDAAFSKIEAEYVESGRADLFDALCPFLHGDDPDRSYADVSRELSMKEGAVKVAVHRLRQRYRRWFEEVVLETVETEADVADEMAFLHEVLSR